MSRIGYTEDEDYPGQFDLWQANCIRSIQGKQGQKELRILREALLSLKDKRLICGMLVDGDEVCAIGAYAKYKGLDLEKFDPEEATDEVGIEAGMPPLVAWKIVAENDYHFDYLTAEKRYEKILAWVEENLLKGDLPPAL